MHCLFIYSLVVCPYSHVFFFGFFAEKKPPQNCINKFIAYSVRVTIAAADANNPVLSLFVPSKWLDPLKNS